MPAGSTAAVLAMLSVTIGAVVATVRDAADVRILVAVLTAGQLLGHALLSAAGHAHQAADSVPFGVMAGAHLVAIVVGAALIDVGGRLCAAVSRVVVLAAHPSRQPVAGVPSLTVDSADQPLQSAVLLSASLSHRGPPVSLAD